MVQIDLPVSCCRAECVNIRVSAIATSYMLWFLNIHHVHSNSNSNETSKVKSNFDSAQMKFILESEKMIDFASIYGILKLKFTQTVRECFVNVSTKVIHFDFEWMWNCNWSLGKNFVDWQQSRNIAKKNKINFSISQRTIAHIQSNRISSYGYERKETRCRIIYFVCRIRLRKTRKRRFVV